MQVETKLQFHEFLAQAEAKEKGDNDDGQGGMELGILLDLAIITGQVLVCGT